MNVSEIMYWLAENYWVGIGVASGIVILSYVGISLLVFFKSRKMYVDVAVGAMVPLWHFKYIVKGIMQTREPKPKKVKSAKVKKIKLASK